ncbi:MAG: glycine/sarcosine/betaine reductase selenoprotein B family protein [Chloroflexota bacterium]
MTKILEDLDGWAEAFEAGWLAHYKESGGFNWKSYNRPKNSEAPSGKGIDLSQSRLALISTAGGYLRDSQEPFDAENDLGDYTIRLFPSSTPFDAIDYAHTHYDQTAVRTDPQVLLPLRHLEAKVEAGEIGELAPSVISFMGYQPDVRRAVNEMIPAIVEAAKAEKIDGALLVPA